MLKDRKALMEQEMVKHKQNCGELYLKIVQGKADLNEEQMYDTMKLKLTDMIVDIAVVNQMIADGHK